MSLKDKVYLIVVGVLAAVIVSVIAVLLIGLFDHNVDNEKIFAILGPAFQTVIGCFVGVLSGRLLDNKSSPP